MKDELTRGWLHIKQQQHDRRCDIFYCYYYHYYTIFLYLYFFFYFVWLWACVCVCVNYPSWFWSDTMKMVRQQQKDINFREKKIQFKRGKPMSRTTTADTKWKKQQTTKENPNKMRRKKQHWQRNKMKRDHTVTIITTATTKKSVKHHLLWLFFGDIETKYSI